MKFDDTSLSLWLQSKLLVSVHTSSLFYLNLMYFLCILDVKKKL